MARITDVARRAGVSPSTVSYALSGKRPISEATRRRVEAAVRELGYRPHSGGRSRVLALLVPLRSGVDVPVVTRFAVSVVGAARAHDHDVLLVTGEDGEQGLRGIAAAGTADAVIVMDVELRDPRLPLLRRLGRPSVLIGVPAEPDGLTCVDLDFRAAAELCVNHLAGLGHRVVALIGSPPEVYLRQTAFAHRVLGGFTAAADRAGLVSSVHPCAAGRDGARRIAEALLARHPAPTGVVVHNEPLLGPLVDAFRRLGLRVPGDLSVTAICPDEVAAAARVPVTSVCVPAEEAGRRAVDLLMSGPAGAPAPAVTLLAPRLTPRASTAPPPVP
ncbi:LacI family DNA-binding transcriptional regulator [Streptomyces sp. HMX87]|uniref:LacI family DNA-binding transcriptional regulator n=1 Tax=Streptomyces sp. HMX87 TaxID=3390849 RepID=UPI003A873062